MRALCYDPKHEEYHNYGGKGAAVCNEWRNDFWAFAAWCNSSGFIKGQVLGLICKDGDFSPDNCRAVTRANNTGKGSSHRHHQRWCAMIDRCYNPDSQYYSRYGGRGITVCEEWRDNSHAFAAWCGLSGFMEGLELDRTDNERGYFPENCRWVTHKENCQNRTSTPAWRESARKARSTPGFRERSIEATSKPVICITTGKSYPSLSAACREMGLDTGAVCKVLKGQRNHAGGHKFSYV